jgi:hypothetical protein
MMPNEKMLASWRCVLMGMVMGIIVIGWLPAARAAESRPDLARVQAQLNSWLQDAGLAPTLTLQRLGWGKRADDASVPWLMLELSFVKRDTKQQDETMRFEQMLKQFEIERGMPLADVLFYKLVHSAQIARRDARVTVAVLEDTYAVLRDPTSGALHFGPASIRATRSPTTLHVDGTSPLGTRVAPLVPGVGVGSLPARVRDYLVDFFARHNSTAGRPAPLVERKQLESDYVGLEVTGLRKLVITDSDYWERLQVSVELRQDARGARAVCYLDGGYAPGLGAKWPAVGSYTDIEKNYRTQLQTFSDVLMEGLQKYLAGGGT